MKKILEKIPSATYSLLLIPLVLTVASFGLYFSSGSKGQTLSEIKYGVNLCFTRLTQSVIALQSHDYFSKHLERSYIDFTNECFFEFKEKVTQTFSDIEASKLVDQLLGDAQSFSKSLVGVLGKRQAEVSKGIVQSQILPSYSKVDFSRFNLNQWIKKQEASSGGLTWQTSIFILILLCINLALIYFIWSFNQNTIRAKELERKANDLTNDLDQQPHRMEVFLAEILDKYGLNNSQEVLRKYSECLINQSQILAKMKGIKEVSIESSNAAAIALESDEWKTKDITNSVITNTQLNTQLNTIATFEDMQPPAFNLQTKPIQDSIAKWTEEDESENILDVEQQHLNFSPVNEPISDLSNIIQVAAKNLAINGSNTTIIHHASGAPFYLKGDHEHHEQLFIAILNKIEARFKDFSTPAELCCVNIDYDHDPIIGQASITIAAKKAMFHIDDLEYFHDHDHLTVDSYNIIIKEMVKELYSEISFRNLLGENLDDNSLQVTLKVPVKAKEVEKHEPKVVQLIRGKKKDIQKQKNKEITI